MLPIKIQTQHEKKQQQTKNTKKLKRNDEVGNNEKQWEISKKSKGPKWPGQG